MVANVQENTRAEARFSKKVTFNFIEIALRHECSFPWKFAAYFQNTFSYEHLKRTNSES